MLLGFALTRHCNLRCPHCIRDDVTEVRAVPLPLIERIVDEARELFGAVTCSFTGGEPTIHPEWNALIDSLRSRGIGWRMVTNGWHMRRIMPSIDRHPPGAVRVSLSGATEDVHDEERGKGSFKRVQLAVALLTSRQVPTGLSIVIDKRDRHQIRQAADLAEDLGCNWISFILPQPVPASADRSSDLSPDDWYRVRDEVAELGRESHRSTRVLMDYGAPFDGDEVECDTMTLKRIYVDPDARVSLCCQLSDYGFNTRDITGDLNQRSLGDIYQDYLLAMDELRAQAVRPPCHDPLSLDAFPCFRCARALGKLDFLEQFPESPWGLHSLSTISLRPVSNFYIE
jgi:MoaA/NifB/PqqE/SkfB family radical SAM enzyme